MADETVININNSEYTIAIAGDTIYTLELSSTGSRGKAGTITVGTTTTLAGGSPATVENVGTTDDAIFNFGIPAGIDSDMLKEIYDPANGSKQVAFADDVSTSLSGKVDKVDGKELSSNDLTDTLLSNYNTAYTNSHTHVNKVILDGTQESFTTVLKSSYDGSVASSHTHSNKTILDAIQESLTTALKGNYDTAYTNTHTHNNKTYLDLVANTNTGDETNDTIKTKLGAVSATNEGYVTPTMYNQWNNASDGAGQVLISSTDTTAGYLYDKVVAGNGITLGNINPSGNSDLSISSKPMYLCSSSTDGSIAEKAVTISGVTLADGLSLLLSLENANTASSVTLNLNASTAYPLVDKRGNTPVISNKAGERMLIIFDAVASKWILLSAEFYDARMSMPSSSYISLTLGASGTMYAMASDGYLWLQKTVPTGTYIKLSTPKISSEVYNALSGTREMAIYIPVAKNDVATYASDSASGTVRYFRFVYAEGSKP